MKIIFDNGEQKNHLIDTLCPYDVNLDIDEVWCAELANERFMECVECWERSGIEMEVKDD